VASNNATEGSVQSGSKTRLVLVRTLQHDADTQTRCDQLLSARRYRAERERERERERDCLFHVAFTDTHFVMVCWTQCPTCSSIHFDSIKNGNNGSRDDAFGVPHSHSKPAVTYVRILFTIKFLIRTLLQRIMRMGQTVADSR